jgi:uncharacterized YccA/Bax inhibitor family protein
MAYGVVNHAYVTREQFYPAVIYLVTNKFSIVVLGNMGVVLVVTLAAFLKAMFLGELKSAEVEVSRAATGKLCAPAVALLSNSCDVGMF